MTPVVAVKGLWFTYDREPVLRDVTFDIEAGDYVAMVGPNGGGKTTLVRLMLGMLQPSRGEITVFGGDPARSRLRMGYVPQFGVMDADFPIKVRDVVAMGLMRPWDPFPFFGRKRMKKAEETMDILGIAGLEERMFGSLSGGQKQRCLIARAVVSSPDVLMLDEPTASIDNNVEKDVFELLKKLNERMTVIIITHDISFVSVYADKIICVNGKAVCHPAEEVTMEGMAEDVYGRKVSGIHHRCGI